MSGNPPERKTISTTESLVGTQSISVGSQSAQTVDPSSNGVSQHRCDIRIQNVGSEDFWVQPSGTTATTGLKIKPGQSVRLPSHDSTDGAIELYPDSSSGLTAECLFRE